MTVNILGIWWNTMTDTISLAPKPLPSSNVVSKRSVLQDSSQLYDQNLSSGSVAKEVLLGYSTRPGLGVINGSTYAETSLTSLTVTFPRAYFHNQSYTN